MNQKLRKIQLFSLNVFIILNTFPISNSLAKADNNINDCSSSLIIKEKKIPLIYKAKFVSKNMSIQSNGNYKIENNYDNLFELKLKGYSNEKIKELYPLESTNANLIDSLNGIYNEFNNNLTSSSFCKEIETKIKFENKVEEKLKTNSVLGNSNGFEKNITEGISKFLYDRAKTEIFTTLLDEIQSKYLKEGIKDIFPYSSRYIIYTNSIFKNDVFINGLRESFSKDLNEIYFNIKKVLSKKTDINGTQKFFIAESINFTENIRKSDKINFLDYFLSINTDSLKDNKNLKSSIMLFQTILDSITIKIDNKNILAIGLLNELINDLKNNKYEFIIAYINLLEEELIKKNIKWEFNGNEMTLSSILSNPEDAKKFLQPLLNIFNQIKILSDLEKEINKDNQKNLLSIYQQYFNNSIDLLDEISTLIPIFKNNVEFTNYYTKQSLSKNTYKNNENSIQSNFNTLDNNINSFKVVLRASGNLAFNILQEKYNSSIINISEVFGSIMLKDDLSKKILKYGIFAINLVESETSDEVQSTIELLVLPPNSSIIKKKEPFNIDIGSYVGIIPNINNSKPFNITAPIGLNLGFRIPSISKDISSLGYIGLFPSFLDLGAVIDNSIIDTNEVKTEFKFQNLLTFGIQIIYSFPKYPISLGAGYQYTFAEPDPQKKVKTNIFLGIDIPLIRITND